MQERRLLTVIPRLLSEGLVVAVGLFLGYPVVASAGTGISEPAESSLYVPFDVRGPDTTPRILAADLPQVKSGTAFFVTHDGKALTSAHVVRDCTEITIWKQDAPPRLATIIGVDPGLDIALLASSGVVSDVASIGKTLSAHTGDPVTSIGFGTRPHEPRWPELTAGTVSGLTVLPWGVRVLAINASLNQGASGGPIIDNAGAVLGLVIGRYADRPDLSVAVPAPEIEKFLKRHGVASSNEPDPSGRRSNRRERPSVDNSVIDTRAWLVQISALVQCRPRPRRRMVRRVHLPISKRQSGRGGRENDAAPR